MSYYYTRLEAKPTTDGIRQLKPIYREEEDLYPALCSYEIRPYSIQLSFNKHDASFDSFLQGLN